MHTDPATNPPPFTLLDCAYRQLTHELCRALPRAPTDAEQEDRNKAAIAQVAGLQPANTAEFEHAALFVVADQRAKHCLARADEPGLPPALALKWTGKADNMMRQAYAATRSLLRLQAARRKIEADPKAYDRGERIEHHMTVLMTEALANPPSASVDDPESHHHQTEILMRQPEPATALVTATPPQPDVTQSLPRAKAQPQAAPVVSPHDPESRESKTETPPRHPALTPNHLASGPTHPGATPRPVSPHDPESHSSKTGTPPRHPAAGPTQRWRPLRPGFDFPLSDLAKEHEDVL